MESTKKSRATDVESSLYQVGSLIGDLLAAAHFSSWVRTGYLLACACIGIARNTYNLADLADVYTKGVHLLLQVKTDVLNVAWEGTFRAWYPQSRATAAFEELRPAV